MDAAWDPAKFDENWSLIRDVRPLVKLYGPGITRIDLLSEGAPSSYQPGILQRVKGYISEMYRRYVDAFGKSDVTVSAIAPPEPNEDITQPDGSRRLQNLIDAFAASGRGQPTFFSIHVTTPCQPSWENVLYGLRQADATLTANGLSQPLIVSESAYNNPAQAAAIERFRQESSRPIVEVLEWPWLAASVCNDFSVSPPFRADAYITALTGSPPSSTLTGSVTPNAITFQTPYHDPVTGLEARRYQIPCRHVDTNRFPATGSGREQEDRNPLPRNRPVACRSPSGYLPLSIKGRPRDAPSPFCRPKGRLSPLRSSHGNVGICGYCDTSLGSSVTRAANSHQASSALFAPATTPRRRPLRAPRR